MVSPKRIRTLRYKAPGYNRIRFETIFVDKRTFKQLLFSFVVIQ